MFIREIMKRDIITTLPTTSVKEAASIMKDNKIGCVIVTENGILRGILTDRDIVCSVVAERKDADYTEVKDVMNTDLIFSSPDTDVVEASRLMAEKEIRRLPIQQDGILKGIVSTADLAPVLKEEMDNFFHLEEMYH